MTYFHILSSGAQPWIWREGPSSYWRFWVPAPKEGSGCYPLKCLENVHKIWSIILHLLHKIINLVNFKVSIEKMYNYKNIELNLLNFKILPRFSLTDIVFLTFNGLLWLNLNLLTFQDVCDPLWTCCLHSSNLLDSLCICPAYLLYICK